MNTLCAIGEALIDFIPDQQGRLKAVTSFQRAAGGAPANVAGTVCRLGGKAKLLTKLGQDAFGDYLLDQMQESGIDTSQILRSSHYDTALAFVSLNAAADRDFKFYRRTAADLQYAPEDVPEQVLDDCSILHFCSVSLVESPMKYAHKKLIDLALANKKRISFDPNLRLSLWDDEEACQNAIREFLPCADILKLSDDEIAFITGCDTIEEALPALFSGRCEYVLYTMGKHGARLYRRNGTCLEVAGIPIHTVDTTGAGDSFIGAFLFCLLADDVTDLQGLDKDHLLAYLSFANAYAACMASRKGALANLADREEFQKFINTHKQVYPCILQER